jgi:hypothetical protein
MPAERKRKIMDRTPRTHPALLVLLALMGWVLAHSLPSLWGPAWRVNVEIAGVRVSIAVGALSVRNRTALFEIGQVAAVLTVGR